MTAQRITLITVVVAILVLAGIIFVPRLTGGGASGELDLSDQPSLGSATAPVEVVLFEDFLCPHCATFTETIFPRIKRDFVDSGQARVYFLNYPVLGPASDQVALVGECVFEQSADAFWELKTVLFRSQSELENRARLLGLVSSYAPDIDAAAVESCLDGRELRGRVQLDASMARSLGLTGTPSVVVDGRVTQASYAAIERAIEQALASQP